MPTRPTSARLVALALLVAAPGCYADHGRGEPLPDASTSVDARPPADAPPADAASCGASDRAVTVRIEPITTDAARCAVTHAEDVAITGVEPAPADDGIRLHADLCPDADADCRCDLVIGHVGIDVAPSVLPTGSLTLDLRAGEGGGPGGAFVSLREAPRCRCDGCACSLSLVLYAADLDPASAPALPPELAVARGAEICAGAACTSGTWSLAVALPGGTSDLPQGTQRDDGAIHVRALRDVDVFAPCADCALCSTAHGSWVAWAAD